MSSSSSRARAAAPPTAQFSRVAQKRLARELEDLRMKGVPGVKVESAETLEEWVLSIVGAEGTVFGGEKYTLRFKFPPDYPIEAPEVIFMQPTPMHEHVYTNGHICLNVLYDGWSPALTVSSVCISILSMLSSATKKERPPDNDMYVRNARGRSPNQTRWIFHDDKV